MLLAFLTPFSSAGQTKATRNSGPGQGPVNGVSESANKLQSLSRSGHLQELRWADFSDYRIHVDTFYRTRSHSLGWIEQGKPNSRALEMIQILLRADGEGLNPEDYYGPRWADQMARLGSPHTLQDEATFDLALNCLRDALHLRCAHRQDQPKALQIRLRRCTQKTRLAHLPDSVAVETD
jgi:L,D-transpeptidase YcbB